MKSNRFFMVGAAKRCATDQAHQQLAPRCGPFPLFEAKQLFSTVPAPVVHYVGFRDDRYWNAYRIWGGPVFVHRWWDKRARREIAENDTVIFAEGDWWQEPRRFNAPDIEEQYL